MQNMPPRKYNLLVRLVNEFVSLITAHYADSVFEHYILLEKVIHRNLVLCVIMHRALEEEAEESLDTIASCSLSYIAKKHEVETERSCKDRVAAEEVDLDLHGIAHPTEDVDVVPAFLVVVARGIIIYSYLVEIILVKVGLFFRHEDTFESRKFTYLLGTEVGGLIEHETVTVAKNVG